jgi:hypothetical protein
MYRNNIIDENTDKPTSDCYKLMSLEEYKNIKSGKKKKKQQEATETTNITKYFFYKTSNLKKFGTKKYIWKMVDRDYGLQVHGINEIEAKLFAKHINCIIYAEELMGNKKEKFYCFKKQYSNMISARKWAKQSGFEFIKE